MKLSGPWVLMLLLIGCGASPAAGTSAPSPPAIAWTDWSEASFDKAEKDRRYILVSLQASWCHWCHVMNDTTYQDPEIRKMIASRFVAVKVDSDARPDLAERYADYAWPATILLSPDAKEVVALRGYRSPEAFQKILESVMAGEVPKTIVAPESPQATNLKAAITVADAQLDAFYDQGRGGWGKTQKYPLAAAVEATLLRASITGDESIREDMLTTLAGHAQLIDPVWGGMFQYSLKGVWDKPHFEKITAIQAGGIKNFAHAYGLTGKERWKIHALDVVKYMSTRMREETGGFYTSQNADAEAMTGTDFYALDATKRSTIEEPVIDKNVYADLNGRMIDALCALHSVAPETNALPLAIDAANNLAKTHIGSDGQVTHGKESDNMRYLSDQAHVLRGMLSLYYATGNPKWLTSAKQIATWSLKNLFDGSAFYAHTIDPHARGTLSERRKPSGHNSVMAQSLLTLYRLTEDKLFDVGAKLLLNVSVEASRRGRKIGDWSLALRQASSPYVLLSVVGPSTDPITEELTKVARSTIAKNHLVEVGRPGESRYPYPGKPAVYLCSDSSCSLPVHDPARLSSRINEFLSQNEQIE